MKRFICSLLALCVASHALYAQDLVQKKHIVYSTKIQDFSGHYHEGFIATMNDTAIFMSERKFAMTFENLDMSQLEKFSYTELNKVKLRPSGRIGRGALIGAVSGLLTGAIVGYCSTSATPPKTSFLNPVITRGQATLIGAVVGAGVGSLIGMLCAHPWQVFKIHGKKINLDDMRETMIRKLY